MRREETVVKFKNLSLADTIRKLQAGNEGGAGDYKIETEVGESSSDGDKPGVCGGL